MGRISLLNAVIFSVSSVFTICFTEGKSNMKWGKSFFIMIIVNKKHSFDYGVHLEATFQSRLADNLL